MSIFSNYPLGSWNGLPMHFTAFSRSPGRKLVIQDYPNQDYPYVEDLGRKTETLSVEGFVVGEVSNIEAAALVIMFQSLPGAGFLIHPSIGAFRCQLIDSSFQMDTEKQNYIGIRAEFVLTSSSLLSTIIGAVSGTLLGVLDTQGTTRSGATALDAISAPAYQAAVAPTLSQGQPVTSAILTTTNSATTQIVAMTRTPQQALTSQNGLNFVTDPNSTTGRYANGNLTQEPVALQALDTSLPQSSRIKAAQALLGASYTLNRLLVEEACQALNEAALAITASGTTIQLALATAAQAVLAAFDTLAGDPQTALTQCSTLAAFQPTVVPGSSAAVQAINDSTSATAAVLRRAALASCARATASMVLTSRTQSQNLIASQSALFNSEIYYASDQGDDTSYQQLTTLKNQVINDLQVRGANLLDLVAMTLPSSLPSLVVSYRLYRTAERADELIARNAVVDPLFFPTSFEAVSQ